MSATFSRACKRSVVAFDAAVKVVSPRAWSAIGEGILRGISLALFVSLFGFYGAEPACSTHSDLKGALVYLWVQSWVRFFIATPVGAGDVRDLNLQDRAKKFDTEIKYSIKQHHSLSSYEQKDFYTDIVKSFFYRDMTVDDAVYILKMSGFHLTVFGDGFYTAYPSDKGSLVSGCFSYAGGFLSGGSLCINLELYRDGDFSAVKDVGVGVSFISP